MDKIIEFTKALTPLIASMGVVIGGLIAYFKYLEKRPMSLAKAKDLSVTGEISLNQAAMRTIASLQKRLDAMDAKFDKREAEHQKVVQSKDEEIIELRGQVLDLKERVITLEAINADLIKTKK